MKTKLWSGIVCFLTILTLLIRTVSVSAGTADEVQSLIDGIVRCKIGNGSVQQWIDGPLAQNSGVNAEWYVLALRQSGEYDFSAYETALLQYLAEKEVYSATSRQKYALALLAAGSDDAYISRALADSIGQQGVMSWVFGLHLLNNGQKNGDHTLSSVKEKLLSLQLADGGWAVMGTVGDVDVTAMALQALAPHYSEDAAVKTAADKALAFLSARQSPLGEYATNGADNAESIAQVMIALSSLGLDGEADPRFIKGEHTLLDALLRYRLADGSFCHTQGGAPNETATAQALCALVAYQRMANGKGALYMLDEKVLAGTTASDSTTASTPETDTDQTQNRSYKLWVSLAIAAVCIVICTALLLTKKRNAKNMVLVMIAAAIAVGVVLLTDIQSVDDFYNGESAVKENAIGTVTLTIRCDEVVGKTDAAYIPDDGVILEVTELAIEDGDTVFDILIKAAQARKLSVVSSGAGGAVYVEGIAHLYEFAFGDLSGWVYDVNGTSPSIGCGEYALSDGDVIEWHYSCDKEKDAAGANV